MLKNKLVLALAATITLVSSATFANKVKFGITDTEGTFHCVVNSPITDHFKSIDIHTDGIEVSGFCRGEEYVQRPGHLVGMTMSELKKYFFEYKKNAGKEGSVNFIASNPEDISCFPGKGENRKAYGNGKYC
jgi:hypothetical protein